MRVFGISNCDKCSEAKKWLAKKEIDFEFIDFRKQALTAEDIKRWIKKFDPNHQSMLVTSKLAKKYIFKENLRLSLIHISEPTRHA